MTNVSHPRYSDEEARSAADGQIDADTVDGQHASQLGAGEATYVYGIDGDYNFERYDIGTDSWATMATPNNGVESITTGNNGYLYAFDGGTKSFERYDIGSDSWTTIAIPSDHPDSLTFGGV